jgi:hypothetical protein
MNGFAEWYGLSVHPKLVVISYENTEGRRQKIIYRAKKRFRAEKNCRVLPTDRAERVSHDLPGIRLTEKTHCDKK